jgi:hypothetical protein
MATMVELGAAELAQVEGGDRPTETVSLSLVAGAHVESLIRLRRVVS